MVAAIAKIKEAEDVSEALAVKAAEEAQGIVRNAAAAARERARAIREEARGKRAEILAKAARDAEAVCAPLDEAAASDILRIQKPDGGAFDAAVGRLVSKLVS